MKRSKVLYTNLIIIIIVMTCDLSQFWLWNPGVLSADFGLLLYRVLSALCWERLIIFGCSAIMRQDVSFYLVVAVDGNWKLSTGSLSQMEASGISLLVLDGKPLIKSLKYSSLYLQISRAILKRTNIIQMYTAVSFPPSSVHCKGTEEIIFIWIKYWCLAFALPIGCVQVYRIVFPY